VIGPRRGVAVAAAIAACAATTAVAFSQVDDEGAQPPGSSGAPPAPPGSAPPVAEASPEIKGAVAALRRPRGPEDVLPADVAEYVGWASYRGANGALARRVLTDARGSVYLLPGDEVVCLLLTGGGGATGPSCSTAAELRSARGGPGVIHSGCDAASGDAVPRCSGATVFGVVPDGVEEVVIRLASGKAVTEPVERNVYLAKVPGDPEAVEFEADGERISQAAP
jgi:hypothetical protein